MNFIIEYFQSGQKGFKSTSKNAFQERYYEEDDEIIGGIGTIEGQILIAYKDKRFVCKAEARNQTDINIFSPINALKIIELGPKANHDILIFDLGVVRLSYCHKSVCEIRSGAHVSLCGRTFIIYGDKNRHYIHSQESELEKGEHLQILKGSIDVRVSAGGHNIYIDCNNSDIIWSKFKR